MPRDRQRAGIRGRASSSLALGADDPRRTHRNAQVQLRGEDYKPPLQIETSGQRRRLEIDTQGLLGVLAPLGVGSRGKTPFRKVLAAESLSVSDVVVLCDTAGGTFIVTLPSAKDMTGRKLYIKNAASSGSNNLTVNPFGLEEADGSTSSFTLATTGDDVTAGGESAILISDGAAWWSLGG